MTAPYAAWIAPITALAVQAGAAILTARERGLRVVTKPDGSPQTNADRDAEAVILAGLRALTPEIPVIAEESAVGKVVDPSRPFWLVDPLDGTKSFIAGVDDFSVNISLVAQTRPVFGVIYAPALDELFWNEPAGAWYRRNGTAHAIQTRTPPAAGITLITSRRTRTGAKLHAFLQPYTIAEQLMFSGAIKYGYLAMGRADLYPRFGTTMEWDNAAGEAIVHAAGGTVTDLDGAPLCYGQPHMTHSGVIVRGK
ncbi:MAG: 3'(2'),5'-bisphosphate nucleotidase CysQ [Alphaproteobacteria bacterium]